jgi:membrane fusion protein YbhG
MKKPLLAIVVILAAGTAWWYRQERQPPQAPTGQLYLYGNIDTRVVDLAFEVSGRIVAMDVSEGARVRPGQALARLDTRPLGLVRDAAAAKAQAQREQLRELKAGSRPEEIRKLEAELAAARIQADNAQRSYRRVRDLQDKRLASPQQADDAKAASQAAAANARALEASLALARAGARVEEIAAARANLSALEAELHLAEHNLAQATLYALSAGVIQTRILEPGDMASPQRPVYTLALTEPLWARVYLPEPSLGKVRPGQPAQVLSDSFPGKVYRGWVGYISPSAEFTPKSVQTEEIRTDLVYQVHIFVCSPADQLRQGMPVTARLSLDAAPLANPGCGGDAGPATGGDAPPG